MTCNDCLLIDLRKIFPGRKQRFEWNVFSVADEKIEISLDGRYMLSSQNGGNQNNAYPASKISLNRITTFMQCVSVK